MVPTASALAAALRAGAGTRYLAVPGPRPHCHALQRQRLGAHRRARGTATSGTPKIAVLPRWSASPSGGLSGLHARVLGDLATRYRYHSPPYLRILGCLYM